MFFAEIAIIGLLALLVAAVVDLRNEKKNGKWMGEQLTAATEAGIAAVHANRESIDRITELEAALIARHTPTVTAAEIVKEVPPRRLRLRQSLSEQVANEATRHNTKQEKHNGIVRNMESLGVKDAAFKAVKEKK